MDCSVKRDQIQICLHHVCSIGNGKPNGHTGLVDAVEPLVVVDPMDIWGELSDVEEFKRKQQQASAWVTKKIKAFSLFLVVTEEDFEEETLQLFAGNDEKWGMQAYERVPTELKKNIMQARMNKKLTQGQLAQIINEKPQIIQEYESGKAIPNQQIIVKPERALGVKLRGKK
ncbi:hypothetical protein F0562_008520 [Nyssa sinensis]|uniref:HTH cro/C1-type domain-containing protein n=1 Tax=Nyssa sinensis TaxID=561372 RepID=A0A5J5AA40_9ASTE|nr:hypothetical protein F0562_008520 [Nyssa sinensis]